MSNNENRFKKGTSDLINKLDEGASSDDNHLTGGDSSAPNNFSGMNGLLADMFPEDQNKQPKGKNVNIYLSTEVADAINNFSNLKGLSKSKLVDTILRRVLLNK